MHPQTFVFFGQVGSGKGTQVEYLMKFLKEHDQLESVYISTGVEFRKLIESGNYVGNIVKADLGRGQLMPDFLTDAIVNNILISSLTAEKHLFLDGYPRTLPQAKIFEEMMNFYGRKNINIIYIEVGKEEAMARNLMRGRTDDTKEGIEKRFDEYANKVVPAMNYFKDKESYNMYAINGEQSRDDVHSDIIKVLGLK